MKCARPLLVLTFCCSAFNFLIASDATLITNLQVTGSTRNLRIDRLQPGTDAYRILSAPSPAGPFQVNSNFFVARYTNILSQATNTGYEWRQSNAAGLSEFYRLESVPLSSNDLLTATILNRLAYGPTPDLLQQLKSEGPHLFLKAQLEPWTIEERVSQTHSNVPFIESLFVPRDGFVERTNAGMADLRAWHLLRAAGADRQLLEIILQFLENHFVTQYDKSRDFFDRYYDSGTMRDRLATQLEHLENSRWREALLKPECTFYDLLKISAESPAMIIYLDTVDSRGDGTRVANENYARELLELFTFGVDNGYGQSDITVMSRAWTGWYVDKVDFTNVFNPFASTTTLIIPGSTNTSTTTKSNLYGAWSFTYRTSRHNSSVKTIFPGKTVPSRYGQPWSGRNYQLVLNNGSTTNGIQDGYQILTHLANQPFTQEYLSIKLCRLLVHENFPHPSQESGTPGYDFYNYAAGQLAPEAQLVHACMMTWETNSPKGQIWKVLKTITDSELFRTHAASQQKVKTPLEMVASTVRALRASTNGTHLQGSFTAFTDGYNLTGTSATSTSPLMRMGDMSLFNREAPDGYPEVGASWISAGTLAERIRFIQAFAIAPNQSGHSDAGDSKTGCDPVGFLRNQLSTQQQRDAAAVVDLLLSCLYPGEGLGNLEYYRQAAIKFLNTDDNGANSPFQNLSVSSTANSTYDNRVRGVLGMLMMLERFQEQ